MHLASRSIPLTIKRAVLARDGLVCRWCGTAVVHNRGRAGCFRPDYLHFDHVIPWGAGGGHTVDNLVVSCASCNLGRKKPKVDVRKGRAWVEFRYGKYWWPDGFAPPRLVDPDRCSVLLAEAAGAVHRDVLEIVREVHRGTVPATGHGEPICVDLPIVPAVAPRRLRRPL